MGFNTNSILLQVITFALIIYSIILHEIGHGFVAYLSGDSTAKDRGRLTLNPVPHIDPLGSILLPIIPMIARFLFHVPMPVFGWAKPVPVNPNNYRNRRGGEILVSLAGVTVNVIVACISFFICSQVKTGIVPQVFLPLGVTNLWLFYLNMIPVPPLDGYHFLVNIIPGRASEYLSNLIAGKEMIFLMILFMVFSSRIGGFLFYPFRMILDVFINLFNLRTIM